MIPVHTERLTRLVDDLEDQLVLAPSVRKLILKAPQRELQPSSSAPRATRLNGSSKELPPPPDWAKNVTCPRCKGLLTPVRAKADKQWGVSITFQCHNPYKKTMCNLVVSLSESLFKMTPDDFLNSDFSWKSVAVDTVPIVGKMETVAAYPFKEPPTNPWLRTTVRKAVFNSFWDLYLKTGFAPEGELVRMAAKDYPQYDVAKIEENVSSLPDWMEKHTGWIVVKDAYGNLEVAGRGKGSSNLDPFSSAKYRKDFGF